MTVDRRNAQGIPVFNFPTNVNPADPSIYTNFTRPGNGIGTTSTVLGPTVQYRPSDQGNSENQLKLDGTYDTDLGPLRSIDFGGQFRWADYYTYQGGGSRLLTPASGSTPAVYQTSANVSYNTQIVDAATVPQRSIGNTYFLTRNEYTNLISALGTTTGGAPMFTGIQGIPSSIPTRLAFANFDPKTLGQFYDLSGFNQSLVRQANGLPQIPQVKINETIAAGYVQGNFEQQVFGMRLTGNAGVRYVFTKDVGTGTNIRRQTRLNAAGRPETVVLGAQQLIETIWQFNSKTDEETMRILRDTIILATHVNPDGMELVSDWYMRKSNPQERSTIMKEVGGILYNAYASLPLLYLNAEVAVDPNVVAEYKADIGAYGASVGHEYTKAA